MQDRNDLTKLYKQMQKLDVFADDYSRKIQKTMDGFFGYDRSQVTEEPWEYQPDAEEFLVRDGRFFADYKGAHFEAFFKGNPSSGNLVVTFGIARVADNHFREQLPLFSRWSWHTFIDGSFLCLEDPMYYRYDRLECGWFYGDEDQDYAVYAAELIRKVADSLDIRNEEIILYGSSAGGTTAIRAGAALPGCRVAAINSQLDISAMGLFGSFQKITGIDYKKEDAFCRNDMARLVKNSPRTTFLLICNAESRGDIKLQLEGFANRMDAVQSPRLGLSKLAPNTAVWIYEATGRYPHVVQDNYHMYAYIRYLLEDISDADFVQKHQTECLYVTDWHRDLTKLYYRNELLGSENQRLKSDRVRLYREILKDYRQDFHGLNEQQTARVDVISHAPGRTQTVNDLKWVYVSDDEVRLQAPDWFFKEDGQGYVLESDTGRRELEFAVKCIGSGTLEVTLRGVYKAKGEKSIPVWIDYRSLKINNEIIFNEKKQVCHDLPYKTQRHVADGETVVIAVQWEQHEA